MFASTEIIIPAKSKDVIRLNFGSSKQNVEKSSKPVPLKVIDETYDERDIKEFNNFFNFSSDKSSSIFVFSMQNMHLDFVTKKKSSQVR
jgi:hypothetical protein